MREKAVRWATVDVCCLLGPMFGAGDGGLIHERLSEGRTILMMCRFRCSRHGREMGYEAVDTA